METRHIKLGYEESLSAKKHLLSSELNLLQMIKRLKAYRLLRKKELITKTNLKKEITDIRLKLNLIGSTFPSQNFNENTRIKRAVKNVKDRESIGIQEELEEIQRKLEKLGN